MRLSASILGPPGRVQQNDFHAVRHNVVFMQGIPADISRGGEVTINHRTEAEEMLEEITRRISHGLMGDCFEMQVHVTRALAHAVLALRDDAVTVPGPALESDDPSAGITPAADSLPEIIVYRGDRVDDWRTAPTQLAKSEPFALRDVSALRKILDEQAGND